MTVPTMDNVWWKVCVAIVALVSSPQCMVSLFGPWLFCGRRARETGGAGFEDGLISLRRSIFMDYDQYRDSVCGGSQVIAPPHNFVSAFCRTARLFSPNKQNKHTRRGSRLERLNACLQTGSPSFQTRLEAWIASVPNRGSWPQMSVGASEIVVTW